MTSSFAVNWDYRCPFARNVHEHLLAGLAAGADWDITFLPFSLGQAHVPEGDLSVWEDPAQDSGILALQAGVEVRDSFPDQFLAVHRALFTARHDDHLQIKDPQVVSSILDNNGVDAGAVMAAIDSGDVLRRVQEEHEGFVRSHKVWGVPTFIVGHHASFVRLMNRPDNGPTAAAESIHAIDRIVQLLDWPELNEFKHTSLQN